MKNLPAPPRGTRSPSSLAPETAYALAANGHRSSAGSGEENLLMDEKEVKTFSYSFLATFMLMTFALEAFSVTSLWGLTATLFSGYCAAHYWTRHRCGRSIS